MKTTLEILIIIISISILYRVANGVEDIYEDDQTENRNAHKLLFKMYNSALNRLSIVEKRIEDIEDISRRLKELEDYKENASKYLHKGSQCAVQGRIQTGSYEDNEGKTIYTTDVFADNVEYLDTRNDTQNNVQANNNQNRNNYTNNQSNSKEDYFGDDFEEVTDDGRIPF